MSFRSILPHEPWPIDDTAGYLLVQGGFEPRSHIEAREEANIDDESDSIKTNPASKLFWTPNSLTKILMQILGEQDKSERNDLHLPYSIISAEILNEGATISDLYHEIGDTNDILITKVRLGFPSSYAAYRVWQEWRRQRITPAVLFGSLAIKAALDVLAGGDDDDDGETPKSNGHSNTTMTWSNRPFQLTPITKHPILHSVHETTFSLSTTSSLADMDHETITQIYWPRKNPPKFRRLIPRKGEDTTVLDEERNQTRFIFVSNLFASVAEVAAANTSTNTKPNDDHLSMLLEDTSLLVEAIRTVFQPYDLTGYGVEVFVAPHKKKIAMYCHVGMRCHVDACRVMSELQNTVVHWPVNADNTIPSGKLFLDYAAITHRSMAVAQARLLGEDDPDKGQPARSECTSLTNHIAIPGLTIIPDFISEAAEETLMATITGPHAPWAPLQATPTEGGVVKRKVQHYGYVFDYRTADVLRNRAASMVASCPPLPSIRRHNCTENNCTEAMLNDSEMHIHETLESYTNRCIEQGRGWELFACIVARIRSFPFSKLTETNSHVSTTYPFINQVTVNQYEPGDGIGSHIDTPSAFGDGLISLSLNAGIVMEFRRALGASEQTMGEDRKLMYLPRRSLLLMSGPARYEWEHMIVTRMTDNHNGTVLPRHLRISLTLRTALDASSNVLPKVESSVFPLVWGMLETETERPQQGKEIQIQSPSMLSKEISVPSSAVLVTPACERDHVHAVYDAIAEQWHHTRGRRGVLWPGATQFLQNLPPGSVVADIGCGDGKYFPAIWETACYVVGTDISLPLLKTAIQDVFALNANVPENRRVSSHRVHFNKRPTIAVADCVSIPLRSSSFDAAISIAVLHHISTRARRIQCLQELARIVRPGGSIMVQVWAMEQEENSRRKFATNDVFVPFNAQPKYLNMNYGQSMPRLPSCDETTPEVNASQSSTSSLAQSYSRKHNAACNDQHGLVVFQRYCHLYRHGELEDLVHNISRVELIKSGFESGNHFIILRVL
jgi:alkylated DNA repair dioxygenase AlkB/SAM-dependent methyltransferase